MDWLEWAEKNYDWKIIEITPTVEDWLEWAEKSYDSLSTKDKCKYKEVMDELEK